MIGEFPSLLLGLNTVFHLLAVHCCTYRMLCTLFDCTVAFVSQLNERINAISQSLSHWVGWSVIQSIIQLFYFSKTKCLMTAMALVMIKEPGFSQDVPISSKPRLWSLIWSFYFVVFRWSGKQIYQNVKRRCRALVFTHWTCFMAVPVPLAVVVSA